jgi:hypothetical protein
MEQGATLYSNNNTQGTREVAATDIRPQIFVEDATPKTIRRRKRSLFSSPTATIVPEEIMVTEEQVKA